MEFDLVGVWLRACTALNLGWYVKLVGPGLELSVKPRSACGGSCMLAEAG